MRRPGRFALLTAAVALTVTGAARAGPAAAATPTASPTGTASAPADSWTVYHGDPAGSGAGTLPGPVDTVSFWLKPSGFFDRNPALDRPPDGACQAGDS